ncbi:hypothetical protein SAMN05518849_112108 [Sphingobium sp. AP50]|uniref:hypothetical protein n=1 Tax=Sphingobium sp. AP50 TaxID=1884369 RepID=UPI0008B9F1D7|nr:hypothetical protein [Sphingobium sp. AP50]SEJ74006.1 hypothetical protein SAMN05518849_112108 [Sphingobium sp. AP50]
MPAFVAAPFIMFIHPVRLFQAPGLVQMAVRHNLSPIFGARKQYIPKLTFRFDYTQTFQEKM